MNPKTTGDVAYKWVQWGYNADSFSLEDVWSIYAKQTPLMLAVPMDVGGASAAAKPRSESLPARSKISWKLVRLSR